MKWKDQDSFYDGIYEKYCDRLASLLANLLIDITNSFPQYGGILLKSIDDLPFESYLKILSAPETYYILSRTRERKLDLALSFLSNSVEAEYCRLGVKHMITKDLWSCLGDCYFPKGQYICINRDHIDNNELMTWRPTEIYFSPLLRNSIAIDYCSPFAINKEHNMIEHNTQFTSDEIRKTLEIMNGAIRAIEKTNKYVSDVITCFTKVIVLQKDLRSSPPHWGASTSTGRIGEILLENPHMEWINEVTIVNSLVHETIHSLTYAIEIEEPIILDKSIYFNFEVRSPWTGNILPLHNYLHACLVWFGLWNFWNDAKDTESFHEDEIDKQISKSYSGFKECSLLDPISEVSSYISSDYKDLIRQIEQNFHS